ncbi:hypothetical protein GCM10023310_72070 [Paenibacillus vulneris]|uniref:Uncharacterized protein n=1 Tax=Paenibacillus vulneris TaxID=1133364 RepID=A0ABW3UYN3_9BACL
MTKLPERVQTAIAAYQETVQTATEQSRRVNDRAAEIQAELERARAELDAAVDKAIEDPALANTRKESELRKKVAELTLDLSGSEQRQRRASMMGMDKQRDLAQQAIKIGREEARKYFDEHYAEALRKIADAKYAYLKAVVDYHDMRKQAFNIWRESAEQTNANFAGEKPSFPEESFSYRGGNRQEYGIVQQEVDNALKHGIIRKYSVADGREIEERY